MESCYACCVAPAAYSPPPIVGAERVCSCRESHWAVLRRCAIGHVRSPKLKAQADALKMRERGPGELFTFSKGGGMVHLMRWYLVRWPLSQTTAPIRRGLEDVHACGCGRKQGPVALHHPQTQGRAADDGRKLQCTVKTSTLRLRAICELHLINHSYSVWR